MAKGKLIAVDFRQEGSILQVLTPPTALISSREAAWNNLHFEYHYHLPHETPEHQPTQHVIAIQTEGHVQAERRLDGQLQCEQITPGDVCLVPAHTAHWIHSTGEQGLIFLSLDPAFLRQVAYDAINTESVELVPQFARPDPLILQIGLSLKSALQSDPLGSRFYADSLGTALAAHLLQHYSVRNPTLETTANSLPRAKVQLAIDYINDHITEELSLEAIANAVGISQYHFCRSFKQVTGLSPWQYVIQQRIDFAKRLLETPQRTISETSRLLGFSTQGQFANFFLRHTGLSPSNYRQNL